MDEYDDSYDSGDSGSIVNSLLQTATSLGSTALQATVGPTAYSYSYPPNNGSPAPYGTLAPMSTSSSTILWLLIIAAAVIVAIKFL